MPSTCSKSPPLPTIRAASRGDGDPIPNYRQRERDRWRRLLGPSHLLHFGGRKMIPVGNLRCCYSFGNNELVGKSLPARHVPINQHLLLLSITKLVLLKYDQGLSRHARTSPRPANTCMPPRSKNGSRLDEAPYSKPSSQSSEQVQ
jgi:hypothetical protein